jgi:peptide/nickel transport system substrate-binding protein
MVIRYSKDISNFDPDGSGGAGSCMSAWFEQMHIDDWTVNPAVYQFPTIFRPFNYLKGQLAASWEFTDPSTYVVHLRQGIHWQNIAPVNGREFISSDIVYHYHRMFGGGDGYTKPNPNQLSGYVSWVHCTSITAPDNYTVVFKWDIPSPEFISETLYPDSTPSLIEAPEAVKQWGDLSDWHHAIGTGPFILQDFVSGSSVTLVKNPNYWGHDERYPQNQLPYIDALRILIIPDNATALAAVRSGKIDAIESLSPSTAQSLQKTNPELKFVTVPTGASESIDPRNDVAPFNDIRVRKAMQMAIDLPTICSTYYNNTCTPYPDSLTGQYLVGWGWPYTQWPQSLKDEYAYNPTAAKALLAAAGYPAGFKTDLVADSSGDMDLLQIVKSYFAAIGIDMEIRPMDFASWSTFVGTNHKQDALAYRGGGSSIGLQYEPLRQVVRFQTGYASNYNMVSDPVLDTVYPKALAATSVDQVQQILIDANKEVSQQHVCIALLHAKTFAFYQPWLKGYSAQTLGIAGLGGGGAGLLFFYPARFWIDQNIKKSSGH